MKAEKKVASLPCGPDYTESVCASMTWKRTRLFSYQTHVATVDRRGKVLYITTKEYSQTTTRQMRDMERLASCNGFHIVPTERVEAYANILEGQYHTY